MTEPYVLLIPQPTSPISENAQRRAARSPKGRGAAIELSHKLNAWKTATFAAWKQQRFGPVGAVLGQKCEVVCEIGFHTRRTRDPHNYIGTIVKSVIDGLVIAGVWPDDNPEWVKVGEPVLVVHPRTPETTSLLCAVKFSLMEEV